MKVLIWLACILVYSALQAVIRSQGIILGGVPTVLLALLMVFLPAPALCKLWDKRKKLPPAIPHDEPKERWYTCQKCGQLVREGEDCDCEPKVVAAEQEVDKPKKKSIAVPILSAACVVLAVCTCFLGYTAYNLEKNKIIIEEEIEIVDKTSFSNGFATGYAIANGESKSEASLFLQRKAAEKAIEIDREYGPGAYGGTYQTFSNSKDDAEDGSTSFSEWTTRENAKKEAKEDWESLRDDGYINISFDEWWVFVQGTYLQEAENGLTLTQESTGKTWTSGG